MLNVLNLEKSFGSLAVTQNVSLSLPAGRRHGLIGPNGAGKTTFFNLLTGELQPDNGSIYLAEQDITRKPPEYRAKAGIARSFQRNNLFLDLSVRENFAISCALQQKITHVGWRKLARFPAIKQTIETQADRLGLTSDLDNPVKQLSYGTQRQLEIALALLSEPRVLLLDEPTSGMSPEETTSIKKLIQSLPDTLTLLIVEHDMDVIFDLAERITVLDYGHVLFEGTPQEIRNSPEVKARYLGEDHAPA